MTQWPRVATALGAVAGLGAAALVWSAVAPSDPLVEAVEHVYAAGDPRDADGFQAASLPLDLAQPLLADGGLSPQQVGELDVAGEVATEQGHAHVVETGDGRRWCVTEDGEVTFDCMLAWRFASAGTDTDVRAAVRLRHYPEAVVVALEMVNETADQLPLTDATLLVATSPGLAPSGVLVGPSGEVTEPHGPQRPWRPGEHAFLTFRATGEQAAELRAAAHLEVTFPWGHVDADLLETTWLIGGHDEDHEH